VDLNGGKISKRAENPRMMLMFLKSPLINEYRYNSKLYILEKKSQYFNYIQCFAYNMLKMY
jgi:hypothetical protein